MIPDIQYAETSDGAFVAHQVAGDGPVDIVYATGWFSNIDLIWEQPDIEPFLRGLSQRNRLILFDRRGTGLSDPMVEVFDLDTMIEDVRAVMDTAGSERAVLVGTSISAGFMAVFAASFPERTLGLVMIHALAGAPGRPTTRGARRRSSTGRRPSRPQPGGGPGSSNGGSFETSRTTLVRRTPRTSPGWLGTRATA